MKKMLLSVLRRMPRSVIRRMGPVRAIDRKTLAFIVAGGKAPTASQKTKVRRIFPYLTRTMRSYNINTPLRMAHFLAQIIHESGGFRYYEEIWGPTTAQRRYDTRTDLGNTPQKDGDGYLYRGRGLIQLTGKANYEAYSKAKGKDFVKNPDLVAKPKYAADVAGWYWEKMNLNKYSDSDDLRAITRRINGGYNGFSRREKLLTAAKETLGIA